MNPGDHVKIFRAVLERHNFKRQFRLPDHLIESIQVDAFERQNDGLSKMQMITNQVVMEFDMAVYGQTDQQVYSTTYNSPKTWWDHFKQDVLPKYSKYKLVANYLKKHPAELKEEKREIIIDHRALFTSLRNNFPQHVIEINSTPSPKIMSQYSCDSKEKTIHSEEHDHYMEQRRHRENIGPGFTPEEFNPKRKGNGEQTN